MAHAVTLPNGYAVSDDPARLELEFIHAALAGAYWAVGRSRAQTERAVANCLCFGIYAPDGAQAGFARVMTDRTFRAHLADTIIQPGARGLGLGRGVGPCRGGKQEREDGEETEQRGHGVVSARQAVAVNSPGPLPA